MGLIYMRISPSGGKYIGKSTKPELYRWTDHVREAYDINNKDYNSILNKAIRKYGKDNFTVQILEDNIDDIQLPQREKYWINYYQTYFLQNNHGYNMTLGGDGVTKYTIDDFLPLWNLGYSIIDIHNLTGIRRDTIAKYLHNANISQDEINRRGLISQRKSQYTFDLDEMYRLWNEGKNLKEIKEYFNLDVNNKSVSKTLKEFYGVTQEEIKQRGLQTRKRSK